MMFILVMVTLSDSQIVYHPSITPWYNQSSKVTERKCEMKIAE